MALKVVTANLLRGGNVVFLTREGRWSERIDEAGVAESDAAAEALEALARRDGDDTEAVDIYLVDVERTQDGLRPVRYREWLRTRGPTVRPDLGYQNAARTQ